MLQNDIAQNLGIPLGDTISSILSDLYLYNYERQYSAYNNILLYCYIDDIILIFYDDKTISHFFVLLNINLIQK